MEVPYKALAAAEAAARAAFPEARSVKAIWTPGSAHEINVEVWADGRAHVIPVPAEQVTA